jgi:hypothetical protein
MGMSGDVWSVTQQSDADFYVEAVTPVAGGALTVANSVPARNGVGYQVTVTSDGADGGRTFTITGIGMDGAVLTEAITGPATTTVTGSSYFVEVTGVSVDAATAGEITVGYGGNFALPMTRIKYVYYEATATAGSITVTRASDSAQLFYLPTPSAADHTDSMLFPGEGIRTTYTTGDYATVATTNLVTLNFVCG